MKIEPFTHYHKQMSTLGKCHWSVPKLIELSKDLRVMDIPLDHLNIYYTYENQSLRNMVAHIKAVMAADLTCPIILDEDGEVMDGRHRIMRALVEEKKRLKPSGLRQTRRNANTIAVN